MTRLEHDETRDVQRAAAERVAGLPADRLPVDWRRVRRPLTVVCFSMSLLGAVAASLGSMVAGRLAEDATSRLVVLLALCVVGGAVIDTVAKVTWATVVDRAEGRLRADLLDAAMAQPLAELSEQAVGEVLDRIDDDTWEVGQLMRWGVWQAARTFLASGPLWVVATIAWWPAVFLFPLTALAAYAVVRRLLPLVAERKVIEEAAWTDHAASTEEGVAARDDLRTALGQAHVLRRNARLAARIHEALGVVLQVEVRITRRSGGLLHGALAGVGVVGVALVLAEDLSTARLVTLFLVTTMFVGGVDMLARHLPDLQEGFGAVLRLRAMLASPAEPTGGLPLHEGLIDVEFRDLEFSYGTGTFALRGIDLVVPAGHTCALVGRTGSGKSTLASLLSRAVEPPRGSVLLGGTDVRDLDLQRLRAAVGVVTQRTEVLTGTLAQNITLFGDVSRTRVQATVAELGLTEWVAGLPDGLDTMLGPGGTSLSAGEEQLVAFARLLVRDVRVVVLDEATARMDPVTEGHVVRAAERLLSGRTGILVAHRLSTTERAEQIAVLESGRVVQQGARGRLAAQDGPFRRLLEAAAHEAVVQEAVVQEAVVHEAVVQEHHHELASIGSARRSTTPPPRPALAKSPSLARQVLHAVSIQPQWGLLGAFLFLAASLTGAFGAITGWVWGLVVTDLQVGRRPGWLTAALVGSLLVGPLLLSQAFRSYPHWWVEVELRVRAAVLAGQTAQRRLLRTPPGEVVARTMDADRLARYTDRWVDFVNGLVVAAVTALIAGTWLAGAVLIVVMVASALASTFGRRVAGRSAAAASTARARFGQSLVSALESIRTVKLAAATPQVHEHLRQVDGGRVDAAVREHRVQALLEGVPYVMVQGGVVAAWAGLLHGTWELATALLVANAVSGFDWFGRVAGSVVTEAPGVRAWMNATSELAGGGDLMDLPPGMDLVRGAADQPQPGPRDPLHTLTLRQVTAVHDDGTIGVQDVDLTVAAGELVLLLGQVGSGKSSLLSSLAGLTSHTGHVLWNGRPLGDPEVELRPGRVAHVAQRPRVLSGTFTGNVSLDHPYRRVEPALLTARMGRDVAEAGGSDALVGHRGVRLSGGQVQRLALARALACEADLLLADDVSSALDAATEIELWAALRAGGATVIGATSKAAALAQADRVVVLDGGRVIAAAPWPELSPRWGHLAG
ncbi:MAG: ABC transporter ATP-binding protein/permease [Intrasporangium sp.]|uniref:ATP-binding cassette domain-containing protein n=1 Tax=Intrasporangium sp. TaxID=1925024 RepID=UPI002647227D|nr:ABC transporter ATP-binding protein [Intrasporangium sp.]MDN5798246.1 ABC transporter ATP-binding protein/permease [Intrasporangium sp.]